LEQAGLLSRYLQTLRVSGIAFLLCIASIGGFETATAGTNRLHPASAAHLSSTLDRYLDIETQGGWPTVPAGPALRIESFGPSVARLKQRLSLTKDLTEQNDRPMEFDKGLFAAVMHFQSRHGLVVDGVVGRRTRSALNVSVGQRIRQINANLARLQSLQDGDTKRMILINVPGFNLNIIEDGKVIFSSPVIVGRSSRPTPVLSSVITKAVVNPFWRIPRRIATQDILPKLKRDPSYLRTQSIRVYKASGNSQIEVTAEAIDWRSLNANKFPYLLVQDPGPFNALGRVKFFLPNELDIFVHDTPKRNLFDHNPRAFSSGCIRVGRAVELAEYLLKQDDIRSFQAMAEALKNGETKHIALADPIPVHIVYLTAWADGNGYAHFRDDIYAMDVLVDAGGVQRRDVKLGVTKISDTACIGASRPRAVLH
jgi:L,D-transpeptidase YcbB